MGLETGSHQLNFLPFLKVAMFIWQLNNISVDRIMFNLEHEDKCEWPSYLMTLTDLFFCQYNE